MLAGPPQALLNYTGLTLAPLGHGAVIQPGSAALGGLLLAFLVLREPLTRARIIGVIAHPARPDGARRRGHHRNSWQAQSAAT